jgi:phosphohistidine phosphatase
MKVYLVQHGKPVPKAENPDKPLSERGIGDVQNMAAFLKKRNIRVGAFYHSGKTRARETAEILASTLHPEVMPEEKTGLSPLDDVSSAAAMIQEEGTDCFIAGHLPHLAKLTAFLTTGKEEDASMVGFQQGGVVCLEKGEGEGWAIAWMLIPDLVRPL